MNIQLWQKRNELLREQGPPKQHPSRNSAAPEHNFCHAGHPGKLRDLIGNIVSIDGFNGRAQLLSQVDVCPQPVPILGGHPRKISGLYKKRGKWATKCPRHPCGGPYNLCIGGRRRKAHQNVFTSPVLRLLAPLPCALGNTVRTAAEGQLPQGAELGERGSCVPIAELFPQVPGVHVHKLYPVCLVEHPVWNPV